MSMRRREFLTATAAGLVTGSAGLVRPRASHGQGSKEVVYAGLGGSFQEAVNKAWLQPFERETGIKVIVATFDFGKLGTMVDTKSVEWDLCDFPGSRFGIAQSKNLLEPLDYKIIDASGLPASQRGEFGIAYSTFATIMGWSTRRYSGGQAPASWADFWDVKKLPGPRALRKISYVQLEAALMADGVPPDKLYPLDLDRAFRKLDEIKPHVKVWWTSGQQPISLLADGEVDMANSFDGRIVRAKGEGARLDYTFNQGVIASTWYIVPRGARNRESAMRLAAYILNPKNQARLTEHIPSAPAHPKAFEFIKPELAKTMVTAPENAARMAVQDEGGWWAKNFEATQKRFDAWLIQ